MQSKVERIVFCSLSWVDVWEARRLLPRAVFSPVPSELVDNYANVLPRIKTIIEEAIKQQQPNSTQGN